MSEFNELIKLCWELRNEDKDLFRQIGSPMLEEIERLQKLFEGENDES